MVVVVSEESGKISIAKDGTLIADVNLKDGKSETIINPNTETLIEDLGKNGSIVVYNKKFECSRISELADMYVDLS